ncbi:hypothetical protein POTOM_017884 [Populus tomentosa]|uniref:Uncharacterized protein n=1 Tax=Populus tomentosa TaxID=118781 RepID=A0A8X8D725_POPTO|nr:hypothetical protein POTOM_017884 [Populus tomentosa]
MPVIQLGGKRNHPAILSNTAALPRYATIWREMLKPRMWILSSCFSTEISGPSALYALINHHPCVADVKLVFNSRELKMVVSPICPKTSLHARSNSLPSRPHPIISEFDEHISLIKTRASFLNIFI